MNRIDLKKIALVTLMFATAHAETTPQTDKAEADKSDYDPASENAGYYLMSEEELLSNLNAKTREIYQNLSPEGKELARKTASQRCNNMNECKGLNACKTETNDCAGKGSCKGQGKCALADKNLAVKLVAEKMAKKRSDATK